MFLENFAIRKETIDHAKAAERLSNMFGIEGWNTRVIIVVKNRKDTIESAYILRNKKYESLGYKDINEFIKMGIESEKSVTTKYKVARM